MKYLEHDEYDLKLVEELAIINLSPKPVDTTSGLSTCNRCGARYAGKMESSCFNIVPFIELPGDRYNRKHLLKDVVESAKNKSDYSSRNILQNGTVSYRECSNNYFTWDAQQAYDEYYQFIDFLRSSNTLISNYNKFKQYLTPKTNELLLDSLPDRIVKLEKQNQQMRDAINEIANKINQAGHCLSF